MNETSQNQNVSGLKPAPQQVQLETTDLTEVRLILRVMIAAQKAGQKSRERSLVITKLEEAHMWAGEGMMTE
jgi:hypothetical protein